ncbi:hypothetical protein IU500_15420 [Nocardia terpenica]|uniref:SCO6745 family protein n=1 Tax=Nocardia terpenica TaxID=455432 RepID=UPI001896310D|nr:hypothetical protein [Nocardia terpenica]MBF6105434.1 hypothetical protein [Nocardia terpenica]MBF6113096.1 hypothetical protein [Nocardia terpenica]MBF6119226.1 hypothetical protein [Nocardia terpenica]MBF6152874.1 hypothetical protein [Nocardia terpenica]
MSIAAAVAQQIQSAGGAFMFSREVKAFAAATGTDGFLPGYTRGRGGVLGEVDADVVTAAFGFFPPETVRAAWESVDMPAAKAAHGYLTACQDFGRRKLAEFPDADRLADLLHTVAQAADVAGVPLFAGWRALPLPDDAPGRVQQLLHVLRELRGGLHLIAVRAHEIPPRQAVLISGSPRYTGAEQAKLFGWPEPYTDPTPAQRARWEAAEAMTDTLIAPAFAALTAAEAADLVTLVDAATRHMFTR